MAGRLGTRGGVSRGQGAFRTSPLFSILVVVMVSGILTGCGGGSSSSGSTGSQGSVSFSTNTVSFKATGPFAQAPAAQTITGTASGVTSGTIYVTVQVNSPNSLFTVSDLTIVNHSGQVTVTPAVPSSLSVGSFSGSITINVCLNDPKCNTGQLSGSPQTIPVKYDIASGVDGNVVTPRVVAANAVGTVILRGAGFTGATSVNFGSTAASSLTVVSDSEIDASYPALAAGTYPVTINSGSISFSASMLAVSPPAFTATAIPYPADVAQTFPSPPAGIEYDAQRSALFLLIAGGTSTNPTLVRYAFDGSAWGSPTEVSIAGLVQIRLSADGSHLLALVAADTAHTSMLELDPVTMAQTNITTTSNPETEYACGFALANDGNAIVTPQFTYGFAFGTFSRVFTPMSDGGNCPPVASGNGAIVAMNTAAYIASTGLIAHPGAQTGTGATADLAGDKFLYSGTVQTQNGELLGDVLGLFGQIINSPGTRVYGVTPDPTTGVPTLITFDLTAPPSGNPPLFPQVGTPITLPNNCSASGCPQGFYLLATTPDGSVIFIAGPDGVVVQPIS